MRADRPLLLRCAGAGAVGVALLPTLGGAAVDAAAAPTLVPLVLQVGAVLTVVLLSLWRVRAGLLVLPVLLVTAAASFDGEGRALATSAVATVLVTLGGAVAVLAAGRQDAVSLRPTTPVPGRAVRLRTPTERVRDALLWALLLVPAGVLLYAPPAQPTLPSLSAFCWIALGFAWTLAGWSNWIAPRANEEFELARLRRALAAPRGRWLVAARLVAWLLAATGCGAAAYVIQMAA